MVPEATCIAVRPDSARLGAGRQALHWQKLSHRFLSALGLHSPAQLISPPAHWPLTRLKRYVLLAADSSCPALAASLALHSAAAALQAPGDAAAAAALASLDAAGMEDLKASSSGRGDLALERALAVSVDTMASWEALEDPPELTPAHAQDDSTQLSRLCWVHRRHILAELACREAFAAELQQWSAALADGYQAMRRRGHLLVLSGAQVALDLRSLFGHYAAQALLRSSGLDAPELGGCAPVKARDQKRPARLRSRKQTAAKTAAAGQTLCLWIHDVVQLCTTWGNADVFMLLHVMACVCAGQELRSAARAAMAPALLCARGDLQLQQCTSSAVAAQDALLLFSSAIAVLPFGARRCAPACEDLALFATSCGAAATAFLALQVAGRLATANAVLMSLLGSPSAGAQDTHGRTWEDAEGDVVLHALHACSGAPAEGTLAAILIACDKCQCCAVHARAPYGSLACTQLQAYMSVQMLQAMKRGCTGWSRSTGHGTQTLWP